MVWFWVLVLFTANLKLGLTHIHGGEQPLAKINILQTTVALHESASISAEPVLLGLKGEDTEWITVNFVNPKPSLDDWVGVFSRQSSTHRPVRR